MAEEKPTSTVVEVLLDSHEVHECLEMYNMSRETYMYMSNMCLNCFFPCSIVKSFFSNELVFVL